MITSTSTAAPTSPVHCICHILGHSTLTSSSCARHTHLLGRTTPPSSAAPCSPLCRRPIFTSLPARHTYLLQPAPISTSALAPVPTSLPAHHTHLLPPATTPRDQKPRQRCGARNKKASIVARASMVMLQVIVLAIGRWRLASTIL